MDRMRIGWAPAVGLTVLGFVPVASAAKEIALTLTNELPFDRKAEPVTCGVPFARGLARGPEELALLGPAERAVPCQVLVTARYRDGTPRWVLLDFQADVPARGRAVYRLVKGRPARVPRPLSWRLRDGEVEIDTGVARFRVPTKGSRFLPSAEIGHAGAVAASGLVMLHMAGAAGTGPSFSVTSVRVVDAGPLRATVEVEARAGGDAGHPLLVGVCRMRFYAGKSEVRLFFTLRNPAAHAHPGNIWDLGSGGSVFLEDLSLRIPPAHTVGLASRVGVRLDGPAMDGIDLVYQDSSGGPHWDSANHIDKDYEVPTRFRGYRLFRKGERVGDGRRAAAWIHVTSPEGGAAAAVREFWQNFPKALALEDGVLRIALWPREFAGVHEILGGEQKTHEMLLLFHDASTKTPAVDRRMKAFLRPLYAMPDPAALYATRAFWPTGPLDRAGHPALERTCDAFVDPLGYRRASVITRWDAIDEYGWRHFGDTFADNEVSPPQMVKDHPAHHIGRQPISHFGNEYDVGYGVMLQGLRRADPRWMWLADVLCRHYADIGIYHTDADGAAAYRHGPFTHTTHETAAFRSTHRMYPCEARKYGLRYASGGPNAGHCYVASLAQHYYLTGNRVSRDAFLEVAGWSVESPWFTRRDTHMGDKRGIGNLLMTHVYAYQMTGEKRYYDAAMAMVRLAREPFEGLGATLFVKAAGRFLDMKAENGRLDADYREVRETMLRFGDLYLTLPDDGPRRYLEQTCFYAEVLFTCYLHAPAEHPRREAYYARGKALMDAAEGRWPGTYCPTKTLIMCFANTGAFFKVEAIRGRRK